MVNTNFYDNFIRTVPSIDDYRTFTNEAINYNKTLEEIKTIRKYCGGNCNIEPLGKKSKQHLENLVRMLDRFNLNLINMPGYSEKDSKEEKASKLAIGLVRDMIQSHK